MSNERCKWCGSQSVPIGTGAFDYECQTGYFARSHTCYERQIAALEKEVVKLNKELDNANNIIKQELRGESLS